MSFAFVLSADSNICSKSRLCIRSIRHFHPDIEIYVGNPPDDELPQEILENTTEVFDVPIPISDYPISHKVATLATVQEKTDTENYVLLDSDTVLVDEFLLPSFSGVAACPEPYVANHWTKRAPEEWKSIAETYGFELPDRRITAPMNNREMIPYYNAGVILVNEEDFGKKWLDLTINLYNDDIPDKWFSDQVALALLGFENKITSLPMVYNWPCDAHIPWMTNSIIIHYHKPIWMLTAADKQDVLRELHATEQIPYDYTDVRFPWFVIRMVVNHILCIRGSSYGNIVWASTDSIIDKIQDALRI